MKILSLSLDSKIFDQDSAVARRVVEYGALVDKYTVVVPSHQDKKSKLSDKVEIYGSGGENKFRQLISIYRLGKKLAADYNVITVQDQYYLALAGYLLARKFKLGLEIQVHGWEKNYGLRRLIAQFILPRADAIRCVSQRLRKQLVNDFKVPESKITVVPVFSDLRIKNQELKIKKNLNKFIFLTVGRLVPVKNIGLQITAMHEIIKKYPEVELWIVGDGPGQARLEELSDKLNLKDCIKFLGWQDYLDKFYNQADAFLLTSDEDGWGLAVIEAASFGLPIIMTDVGCAGEVIKDRESGLVISVGDKATLVEAMIEIINSQELRAKLSRAAQKAIRQLPTEEETFQLYKNSWLKAAKK